MDLDIRGQDELKDVEITIKCKRCGNKGKKELNYYYYKGRNRINELTINWMEQKMHFKCNICGYDTEWDL